MTGAREQPQGGRTGGNARQRPRNSEGNGNNLGRSPLSTEAQPQRHPGSNPGTSTNLLIVGYLLDSLRSGWPVADKLLEETAVPRVLSA